MMHTITAKNYLGLTAVVLAVFSMTLIAFPEFVFWLFGSGHTEVGLLFVQFLGTSLAGTSYLNWRARHFNKPVVQAVFAMNIITLSIAVIVGLIMMISYSITYACILVLLMHIAFLSGFLVLYKKVK